jgi:AraC family transcriptional regulator, arabinose operon regulatory protein
MIAENLKNPAETATPPMERIVTGVLRDDASYAVWRSRGTQDYLLMFTLSGKGRVGYGTGEILCLPGDLVLIRPNTRHDYGTARHADAWEIIWAHFHPYPHWLDWLVLPTPAPNLFHLSLEGETRLLIESRLRKMDRLARGALVRRAAFALNALEEALLHCATVAGDAATEVNRRDPRVLRAMAFLTENLARPLQLSEIASAAGLSASRLSHLFRAEVGLTPMQFLERERLARAQQLLKLTARSITNIATEVGFESAIHFSLRFKKAIGISPRDYRKQH